MDFYIQVLNFILVRPTRIELVAYSLGGCRSIRLSYVCVVPLRELHARHRVRCSELTGTVPAYGAELI